MNIKTISILSLLVIGIALLGCNSPQTKNNLPNGDDTDLLNEIDSSWVDETNLDNEQMIPSDSEIAATEATSDWVDENDTVEVGEMI
jgi:hypothetical protein